MLTSILLFYFCHICSGNGGVRHFGKETWCVPISPGIRPEKQFNTSLVLKQASEQVRPNSAIFVLKHGLNNWFYKTDSQNNINLHVLKAVLKENSRNGPWWNTQEHYFSVAANHANYACAYAKVQSHFSLFWSLHRLKTPIDLKASPSASFPGVFTVSHCCWSMLDQTPEKGPE